MLTWRVLSMSTSLLILVIVVAAAVIAIVVALVLLVLNKKSDESMTGGQNTSVAGGQLSSNNGMPKAAPINNQPHSLGNIDSDDFPTLIIPEEQSKPLSNPDDEPTIMLPEDQLKPLTDIDDEPTIMLPENGDVTINPNTFTDESGFTEIRSDSPHIVLITYDDKDVHIDLSSFNKEVVSFGRQPDCDIVINKEYVSRLHGCFYIDNGEWKIKDLNSTNGIYYFRKKVKNLALKNNVIEIYNDKNIKDRVTIVCK